MAKEISTAPIEGEVTLSRAEAAYEMMLAGKTAEQICQHLEFKDEAAIKSCIRAELKREATFVTSGERTKLLAMSLARFDRYRQAIWNSAMMGDPKSIDVGLKIEAAYMKALGTDMPDVQSQSATVLVIGGQEKAYVDKLKELTGEPPSLDG